MPALKWPKGITYRTVRATSRWVFGVGVLAFSVALIGLTKGIWSPVLGRSLVCTEQGRPADAILIENFDPNYLLFERAQALYQSGLAPRILVPVEAASDGNPSTVDAGFVEVMVRVARLNPPQIVPIRQIEPISLNAAKQMLAVLIKEHITSVIVVTSAFRSKRSSLVYNAVLGREGIDVSCVPVSGETTSENWLSTWHGIQDFTEQFTKLQYYRFYVLPSHAWSEQ
jgi:hypothetical protein